MAYTPINWQNGDTITAEKMNKMDNGWSVTSSSGTLIFSETVVTENDGDFNSGVLSYSEEVPDGTLTVTFDGIDYTCTCSDAAFGSLDESFEDYPFLVFYSGKQQSNIIETATEGTHTIAVSAGGGETIETSSDFSAAVNSCVEAPAMSSMVINMVDEGVFQTDKTWDEINAVFFGGGICVVVGYGPVLQMWSDGNGYGYMATGYSYSGNNGQFDPYIFRTPQSETVGAQTLRPYKYNSQMP